MKGVGDMKKIQYLNNEPLTPGLSYIKTVGVGREDGFTGKMVSKVKVLLTVKLC